MAGPNFRAPVFPPWALLLQKPQERLCPPARRVAREVLDILLIDLLGKLGQTAAYLAAKRVFTQRATHEFPLSIQIPAEWKPEFEVLAKELGYPATSAAEIEIRFHPFVDAVASRER